MGLVCQTHHTSAGTPGAKRGGGGVGGVRHEGGGGIGRGEEKSRKRTEEGHGAKILSVHP